MKNINKIDGPVVVGGIGGSGTRVIAEILMELNFYIGNDLNGSLDNLAYTLLFKRRKWFYKKRNNKHVLSHGLSIFEKRMMRSGNLSIPEYLYLINACLSMSLHGHNQEKDGSGRWPLERIKRMFEPFVGDIQDYTGWGWKEPNSHLLIGIMNEYFPGFKYIHTIRHGLDMAFSSNQQQLYNWGPMFGVQLPARNEDIPEASFRYWVEANNSVLKIGERLGKDRFLVVNFDQLCAQPELGIANLLSFLGLVPELKRVDLLISLPKVPLSTGRFHDKELNWVKEDDLSFLQSCGFKVS